MQNRFKYAGLFLFLLCLSVFEVGCATKLAGGGVYNPAPETQAPRMELYQIDAAYAVAYSAVDAVFTWERTNRQALWALDPGIKRALDEIRPQASDARQKFLQARAAYVQALEGSPIAPPATLLAEVNLWLTRITQISQSATVFIEPRPVE
ncbi:MAG: hypothetical protein ACYDC1_11975 [Limisphaerales bacterium]